MSAVGAGANQRACHQTALRLESRAPGASGARRHLNRLGALAFAAAGLLWLTAPAAHAAPITFFFTGGEAAVTADFQNQTIGSGTIDLTGVQVTFDDMVPELVDFEFSAGPTAAIPLGGILVGTSIQLDNVSVLPGAGFQNFLTTGPSAPLDTFDFIVGPVDIAGDASFTGAINQGPIPFAFTNPSLSGKIFLSGSGELVLNGLTLGVVSLPPLGPFPGGDVTLKADLVFTGMVPEPGTAVLMGALLIALAAQGRRAAAAR